MITAIQAGLTAQKTVAMVWSGKAPPGKSEQGSSQQSSSEKSPEQQIPRSCWVQSDLKLTNKDCPEGSKEDGIICWGECPQATTLCGVLCATWWEAALCQIPINLIQKMIIDVFNKVATLTQKAQQAAAQAKSAMDPMLPLQQMPKMPGAPSNSVSDNAAGADVMIKVLEMAMKIIEKIMIPICPEPE